MNIQIIKHNGTPEYAIIPFDEWEKIISRIEEMEDIRDARNISSSIAAGEETFPDDFVKRLSSGKSRLKIWREYESSLWQSWQRPAECQSPPSPKLKTTSELPVLICWLSSRKRYVVTWKILLWRCHNEIIRVGKENQPINKYA